MMTSSAFAGVAPPVLSSDEGLIEGTMCDQKGDYECAIRAYMRAFEALPEPKQQGDEGARAALMCATASWNAFVEDSAVEHLTDGIEILERWRDGAEPRSHGSMSGQVDETIGKLRSIEEPLVRARGALDEGRFESADGAVDEALELMERYALPWETGARIELRLAKARIEAFRALPGPVPPECIERDSSLLEQARERLLRSQDRRPLDDALTTESKEHDTVLSELRDLRATISEEHDACLPDRCTADECPPETCTDDECPPETCTKNGRCTKDPVAPILLAAGILATGAGASLAGEALVFRRFALREADRLGAIARANRSGSEAIYQRNVARIDDYERSVRRRNLGLLVGGSVLVADGITMAIIGARRVHQHRRDSGSKRRARLQLSPSISRSHISLSLTTRF